MKFAHVATKWIGKGVFPDDKWRVDLPEGYTRMRRLLAQYVNLAIDCPSPNVAVVVVQESRKKHEGYIDGLKGKTNQIVLETWEDDGPKTQAATALRLKNFLVRQGMGEELAGLIADFEPEDERDRTEALLEELSLADKRARRRIELEV